MTDKEKTEKTAEIRRHSKLKATRWETAICHIEQLMEYMVENGTNYGAAMDALKEAKTQAQNELKRCWADYYAAEGICDGTHIPLYSRK